MLFHRVSVLRRAIEVRSIIEVVGRTEPHFGDNVIRRFRLRSDEADVLDRRRLGIDQVYDIAVKSARMLQHHRSMLVQKPLLELFLVLSSGGANQCEKLHTGLLPIERGALPEGPKNAGSAQGRGSSVPAPSPYPSHTTKFNVVEWA